VSASGRMVYVVCVSLDSDGSRQSIMSPPVAEQQPRCASQDCMLAAQADSGQADVSLTKLAALMGGRWVNI
jgi:hypothetical protein